VEYINANVIWFPAITAASRARTDREAFPFGTSLMPLMDRALSVYNVYREIARKIEGDFSRSKTYPANWTQ
jgi:hypothetical protein